MGLAVVLAFAGWCAWLMRTVAVERADVEVRVGWLSSAQSLQKEFRKGRDAKTVAALAELARNVAHHHGSDASRAALTTAMGELSKANPNDEALLSALDGFVKATRGETAVLSQKLGQRWSSLYILTVAALASASAALVLLVVSVQRRRRAEFWQQRLASVLADVERARAEAEAASQNKSGFIANMSHELRTPLNAIIGYAELLREDLPQSADPSVAADLDRIIRAGKHLHGMVNAILDLSRIEAGRLELKPSSFELPALVRETLEIMQQKAQAKGLSLRANIGADLDRPTMGDIGRIRQVLLNLVANALNATEHGSVVVQVTRQNDVFRISVDDTGPGIPEDKLGELFKPFSQVSEMQKGGTGLGLAICKKLVEAMGGVIGVESRIGEGSRFWFELPFVS